MGYIDHVVRRGLEHPSTINLLKRAVKDGPEVELPKWGIVILVATFITFILFMSAIEYTLKDVVATLAMVETPSAAITVSPSADANESALKEQKEPLLESGPTITLVHKKPITSSIRGTIRHLVSQAGRFSRWRGIKTLFLYNFCFSLVSGPIRVLVPRMPGDMVLVAGISGALLANLHATWTHKVISMPTKAPFWSRVVPRSNWKILALPAAIKASAVYLCFYIAQTFIVVIGLDSDTKNDNVANYDGNMWLSVVMKVVAVCGITIACGLFIMLPAHVTLIRMEASVLPEDQDTIVPFDRTFAGKVVPKILGGTGAIGFLDAWRSFNWEARRRLVKLYGKIFLIETALFLVLAHVLAFETWAIMGPALGKFLAQAQKEGFSN